MVDRKQRREGIRDSLIRDSKVPLTDLTRLHLLKFQTLTKQHLF